jgi:hypothetical protein
MRSFSLALIAVSATLALPTITRAQAPLRVGLVAGVNSATAGGSDADNFDRRTGFLAGVYLVKPFASGIALRPELLVSRKGTEGTFVDEDGADADASLTLTYLDVPVLLQFERRSSGGLLPHLYAGPSFGFKADCKLEGKSGSVSISFDCDDNFDVKSFDLGGVIGGGLGFPMGGLTATVGARYQHGFSDIAEGSKVQNRVISVYGSLEFGKH